MYDSEIEELLIWFMLIDPEPGAIVPNEADRVVHFADLEGWKRLELHIL